MTMIASAWRLLRGQARRWLPRGGRAAVVLAMSVMGAQQASAQTCQPDKLYDLIVSAFHQSVAQRTDGSWSGWGQHMSPSGTQQLSPADINASTYGATLTGTPLLITTASASTSEQTVLLATDGFYAWGTKDIILNTSFYNAVVFGKTTLGLPSGVLATDVAQLFATSKVLAIVTKTGQAWVLVDSSSGPGAALQGDGSATADSSWHRVSTSTGPLGNVVALRGQVGGSAGAMIVLTDDGTTRKAYTWGSTTYLGDNTAVTSRGFATEMTLPSVPEVAGSKPKMIGVTGGNGTNKTYFVLYDNGRLYGMGSNASKQVGDRTTTDRLTWVPVLRPDGSAFTDVTSFSVQEHDTGYAAAALIDSSMDLYSWGSNHGLMLGAPDVSGGPYYNYDPGIYGGLVKGNIKARYVEIGGHTTAFLKDKSAKFCYVGHRTAGSMGDGTTTNTFESSYNCAQTPSINICGSTGYDYGDAPFIYENGGGSKLAMHFYASSENSLYLGALKPQANDATPKNVVIGTSNVGVNGDYTLDGGNNPVLEEDSVGTGGGILPDIPDTTTSYPLSVTVQNSTGASAYLHAWVDWNNDNKFQPSEYQGATLASQASAQTINLNWTGLSGLLAGRRYIRVRVTTDILPATVEANGVDSRSLGFASDGEIEDHAMQIVNANAPANVPPISIDVTTAPAGIGSTAVKLVLPSSVNAKLNGEDGDGTVVSYRIVTLPSNGTLYQMVGATLVPLVAGQAYEAGVELWYQSTDVATATFTFKAIDDDGAESTQREAVAGGSAATGNAVYTIPKAYITAVNDTGTGASGTSITTTVGSNDTATGGTVGSITGKTDGANGTVTCSGSGAAASCVYTPTNPAWSGSDSYTYTLCMAAPYTAVCQTASVSVTVSSPNIDMTVQVTVPSTPVAFGSAQTVIAVCTNSGNVPATGATCSVDNPGGGTLTLQSCTPTSPQALLAGNGTITCTYSYLTPTGETPSIGLTGRTSATNESTGKDGNNTDTKTLALDGVDVFANIQSPVSASPGDQVSSLVTFGNLGTQHAGGVTYEVVLPPGLDGVQCTGATCEYDPVTGKVTITGLPSTLAGGQQSQVGLKWKTPAGNGNYTLTAKTATTTAGDPVSNNTATAQLSVAAGQSVADVATSVQVPALGGTNQTVAGKVTYTNIGSVTATGVTYKVALDSGTPAVSYQGTPCTVAGDGTLSGCNLPAVLLAGESVELAVSYTTPGTAGQQRQVTSTVSAANDGNTGNNTDTGKTKAQATAPSTTPDVTTTVAPPSKMVPGKTVKVPVTFSNLSPTTAATGMTYVLTLPAGTQDVACTAPVTCLVAGGVVTATGGLPTTLQPGQSAQMELTYTAPAGGSVQIMSRVDATGELPANLGNNVATATSSVAATGPDMAIDVTTLPSKVVPGSPYTGTFTCTNVGTVDAENATCAVTGLPTGVTTGACTIGGVAWTQPGIVPAGAVVTCSVDGTPPMATPAFTVFGTTGATGDTDLSNNTSQLPVPVGTGTPDMVTNWPSLPIMTPGLPYEATYSCTNAGDATATAVSCNATTLPPYLVQGGCTITPPTPAAVWTQGDNVPVGATVSCKVSGTPPVATTGPITVVSTTGVTGIVNKTSTGAIAVLLLAPKSIPTLSEWGLMALSALLALMGFAGFSRRRSV